MLLLQSELDELNSLNEHQEKEKEKEVRNAEEEGVEREGKGE